MKTIYQFAVIKCSREENIYPFVKVYNLHCKIFCYVANIPFSSLCETRFKAPSIFEEIAFWLVLRRFILDSSSLLNLVTMTFDAVLSENISRQQQYKHNCKTQNKIQKVGTTQYPSQPEVGGGKRGVVYTVEISNGDL